MTAGSCRGDRQPTAEQPVPCALDRGHPWLSDTRETKERAVAVPQPPPFPRAELPAVTEETIIYQGVGQEIGHIQQRPGNIMPTGSDGGDRAAGRTVASLVSVFVLGGTGEDAHHPVMSAPSVTSRNLAAGPCGSPGRGHVGWATGQLPGQRQSVSLAAGQEQSPGCPISAPSPASWANAPRLRQGGAGGGHDMAAFGKWVFRWGPPITP